MRDPATTKTATPPAHAKRPGPLDGLLVVALEHAIAAPFATRQLADLGARVIKVERPLVGDFARAYDERVRGLASHFVWCNRSKQSLSLDIKRPEAGAILDRLLSRADVLVQNLAPGASARLGLGVDVVRSKWPRLIVCDISGYGADGPYRDRKAYDLLIQSEAGFLSVTGTPTEMAKAGISIADIASGMYAYSGILSALLHRERTGEGSHIDVSMLEALSEWMSFPLYYAWNDQPAPPRNGASHATIYPYGPFTVGDGRTVMLGLQNEREWQVFCSDVLGLPELASDPRFNSNVNRLNNRDLLGAIIFDSFAQKNAAEVVATLDRAGIANAQVNDMGDLWRHPQLAARGRWRDVDTAAGSIRALRPPAIPDAFSERMDAVPALGEHTGLILQELGYSGAEIDKLRATKTV